MFLLKKNPKNVPDSRGATQVEVSPRPLVNEPVRKRHGVCDSEGLSLILIVPSRSRRARSRSRRSRRECCRGERTR